MERCNDAPDGVGLVLEKTEDEKVKWTDDHDEVVVVLGNKEDEKGEEEELL